MSTSLIRSLNLLRVFTRGLKTNQSAGDIEAEIILNQLYNSVKAQRFEDIVVIKTKFMADPHFYILANAFNHRHLTNGTQLINKTFKNEIKQPYQSFARLSISEEWNVMDFESVVIHLFSRRSREQFDLEQLWAVGSEFDDLTNFQNGDMSTREESGSSR